MPEDFLAFKSWSFSTRHKRKLLGTGEEFLSLNEDDCDYTALVTGLSHVIQDLSNLDMSFQEGLTPSIEKTLGRGSSFIVRVARSSINRPKQAALVYKRSRTEHVQKSRIVSLVREVRILSHPVLQAHQNIIDLKGISWEQDGDSETTLPILVLEYASFGDLSSFLKKTSPDMETRMGICLDVTNGLLALHQLGIAHGDIKFENVLIFPEVSDEQSTSSSYIAKLTDFGFAVVCNGTGTKRLSTGTPPWNSPEWLDLVDEKRIPLTDIYSLGFLIWRCILKGQHPFEQEPFASLPASERAQEIEARKRNDELLDYALLSISQVEGVTSNMRDMLRHSLRADPEKRDLMQILQLLRPVALETVLSTSNLFQIDNAPFQDIRWYLLFSARKSNLLFTKYCMDRKLLTPLADELKNMATNIQTNNLDRLDTAELECVLNNLQADMVTDDFEFVEQHKDFFNPKVNWTHVHIQFDTIQHLQPITKKSLFAGLVHTSQNATTEQRRSDALIHLCICYTLGFGTSSSAELALQSLVKAAMIGNIAAQALVKRMHDALHVKLGELPVTEWLKAGAETGSWIALEDLRCIDMEAHDVALHKFKRRLCGTGVQIFEDETLESVTDDKIESYSGLLKPLNDQDDNIVHCAASCGNTRCLEHLLKKFPHSINSLNRNGETPLLFACRAGHYANAMFLLQNGAQTASYTYSRETPMHWLTSFEGEEVRSIATALVQNGGYYMVWTVAEANVTCFPHYYNGLGEGTPVHRAVERRHSSAVEVLLELESSSTLQKGPLLHGTWQCSPLMLACAMHDTERAELLLASGSSRECINWRLSAGAALQKSALLSRLLDDYDLESFLASNFSHSALYFALVPFDLHHRMCLHGANYTRRMNEMIDLLLKKGAAIDSVAKDTRRMNEVIDLLLKKGAEKDWVAAGNITGFFAAVQSGDIKIVDKVVDVEGLKHCDTPCTKVERTPLQETMYTDQKDIFLHLLELGVDVKGDLKDGSSMLQTCAKSLPADNLYAAQLIERGASTACKGEGVTALATAISNRQYELAKLLLKNGADINEGKVGPEPFTTLGMVLTLGQYSIHPPLKFLLDLPEEYGKVAFAVKDRVSALHFAAYVTSTSDANNTERVFSALLSKFGTPQYLSWEDDSGYRPLDCAISWLNLEAVRSLLRAGAKVNYVIKNDGEILIPDNQPLGFLHLFYFIHMIRWQGSQEGASDSWDREQMPEDEEHSIQGQEEDGDSEDSEGDEEGNERNEENEQEKVNEFKNNIQAILNAQEDLGPWEEFDAQQTWDILTKIGDLLREHGAKLSSELANEYKEAGLAVEELDDVTRIIMAD